jgi:hypothetical protein
LLKLHPRTSLHFQFGWETGRIRWRFPNMTFPSRSLSKNIPSFIDATSQTLKFMHLLLIAAFEQCASLRRTALLSDPTWPAILHCSLASGPNKGRL